MNRSLVYGSNGIVSQDEKQTRRGQNHFSKLLQMASFGRKRLEPSLFEVIPIFQKRDNNAIFLNSSSLTCSLLLK